ncbi:chloride channel protein [Actinomycetospora soli]|uniref:chloride channel protein n=1 Tax=Actinomycetospora soli TaxID=2893887 RepID=UPI001E4DCCD4|nr:chloride channel protein [Actinomycetospora soli]MCD2190949.1 chloride channel protein [Actinomycetospora soli]
MRRPGPLSDFTLTPRVGVIVAWAIPIGALGAGAAWLLLSLIGLITNAVFGGRFSTATVNPGTLGAPWWLVLGAPVVGGLVVGVMARYGSEKIRGHGMPEALEAILFRRSIVEPKVAVLKPTSAAVSIGTGGPFGAEGPIIMTGGALGSLVAQRLTLSDDERKALMVAGAAAGMAATFDAPLASVLLAVELLLFEWRPRSFLPVTAAVVVATLLRVPLLGSGPIFGVDTAGWRIAVPAELLSVGIGVLGGLLAVAVTALVYRSEDAFELLRGRLHWMWWPAIGGLVIGIGGLIVPRALGVGYDVIGDLLSGHAALSLIVGILVVKSLIWGLSLGSGTSGGVLAPTFMIGAALGAFAGLVLPPVGPGFWALVGLAATVGGVMRSPLTGVVFSLELTHAWSALLPLLIASATAYGVSVLLLKRSVLTEKIARRGGHLSREYEVDPHSTRFVDEVMAPVPGDDTDGSGRLRLRVDDDGRLRGLVRRSGEVVDDPVTLGPDDTLLDARHRLLTAGVTAAPVVGKDGELLGTATLAELLGQPAGAGASRTRLSAAGMT